MKNCVKKVSFLFIMILMATLVLGFGASKKIAAESNDFSGWILRTDKETYPISESNPYLGLLHSKKFSITYMNPAGSGSKTVSYSLFRSIAYAERVELVGEGEISDGETHDYDIGGGSFYIRENVEYPGECKYYYFNISTGLFKFNNNFRYGQILEDVAEIRIWNDFDQDTVDGTLTNHTTGEITYFMGWGMDVTDEGSYTVTAKCRVTGKEISSAFVINRTNQFGIILDPVGAVVGTEVTMNHGEYGSNIITQGFTRCLYFDGYAPSQSRFDYRYIVSNAAILNISSYGTITAKAPGTAVITVQNRLNLAKVARITVVVVPDVATESKTIVLTTDKREGQPITGTEVTSGLGQPGETTIHIGKTRLLCLLSGAPSANIQDYIWTSNDLSIATVSEFGTVTGVKAGVVVINCVYKYNPRFIGSLAFVIVA